MTSGRIGSAVTAAGAGLLLVTMFLPRVQAESYEDFFGQYYGADGRPQGVDELPTLDAWFFTVPAAGQLLLILSALGIALTAWLRPDLRARLRAPALWTAALLVLWVVGAVVLFPGLDAPPFERKPGTWAALAAALATAGGLVAVARGR